MKAFASGILLVLWLGLPTVAKAQKWEVVGAIRRDGNMVYLYLDADSAVRKGDRATIDLKETSVGNAETLTIDCVNRQITSRTSPKSRDAGDYSALPADKVPLLVDKACKRFWEIWK